MLRRCTYTVLYFIHHPIAPARPPPSQLPPATACPVQALAFLAGANSIFNGDKLLTTANNDRDEDEAMFAQLGLRSRPAFMNYASGACSFFFLNRRG